MTKISKRAESPKLYSLLFSLKSQITVQFFELLFGTFISFVYLCNVHSEARTGLRGWTDIIREGVYLRFVSWLSGTSQTPKSRREQMQQ